MVKLALLDGLPITSMRSCLSSPFAILGSSATIAASALVVFLRFFAASATMEEGGGQETQTPTSPSPYNAFLRSLTPELWRSLLLWLGEENVLWEFENDCGCWSAMPPQLTSLLESAYRNGFASVAAAPSDHPHDEYHSDLVNMTQTRFRGARGCRKVAVRKIRRVRVTTRRITSD